MNGYEYRQSNVAFNDRLNYAIAKIEREFKNGNIKTETDYAYALKNTVTEFYKKLGKPNFEFEPAADVPSFEHYLKMVASAKEDMATVINGCSANSKMINVSQVAMDDTIGILLKRTSSALSKAMSLENKINSIRSASSITYYDDFKEEDLNSALNGVKDVNHIDTSVGRMSLFPTKSWSTTSKMHVEILDESNGFPGNTHEVYHTLGNINGNVKFKGEIDPHLDLKCILPLGVDGDKEAWFEFEMYNLPDKVKQETSGIGFKYKEGISWITDDKELKLVLKITLDEISDANYFMIEGLPKTISNVSNPIIEKIVVSDGQSVVQTVDVNEELVEKKVIQFRTQKVKNITVYLSQAEPILTKACRQYALNVDPTRISKFIDNSYKGFVQVEKPINSIELIGVKYDQKTSGIIYPNTADENDFLNQEYVKSQLFHNNTAENNYRIQTDVVDAYRYNIAVKKIDIKNREYNQTGTYISKKFYSDEPIRTITLNSTDSIPDIFRKYMKEGEAFNDFIKYFISFDDGNEWHRINPRHRASAGPCTMVINSNTSITNRNKNTKYVDMINDPCEFTVKIELSRPEELVAESPVVDFFMIDVSTEEDL